MRAAMEEIDFDNGSKIKKYKVKKCPFCANSVQVIRKDFSKGDSGNNDPILGQYTIKCNSCDIGFSDIGHISDEDKIIGSLIEKWNRRNGRI